jgi:hypothetical protein
VPQFPKFNDPGKEPKPSTHHTISDYLGHEYNFFQALYEGTENISQDKGGVVGDDTRGRIGFWVINVEDEI